jgi:hypothetical protein
MTSEAPLYELRIAGRTIPFAGYELAPDYWIFFFEDDFTDSNGCPVETK